MKKLKGCPAWLDLSKDRTSFVIVEDRAEIVRYIFKLNIAGFGAYSIAKKLSSTHTPTFSDGGSWDQSVVFNILSNRATYGEYIAGKYDKKSRPQISVVPVANYYPAVIDEVTFQSAHAARQKNLSSGRGRKGNLITNLFAGLTSCSYCGSAVKFVSNGQSKRLICASVLEGLACVRFGWSYENFESVVFHLLKSDTHAKHQFSDQLSKLEAGRSENEIYDARANLALGLRSGIRQIVIAAAGVDAPAAKEGLILRDHPDRFFTIVLIDGNAATGKPVHPERTVRFDPAAVAQALGLTTRQGQLVSLVAEGETLAGAASILQMTFETARWHLRRIFAITGVHSQGELIDRAFAQSPPVKRTAT